MKRKLWAIVLIAVMILTACGGEEESVSRGKTREYAKNAPEEKTTLLASLIRSKSS